MLATGRKERTSKKGVENGLPSMCQEHLLATGCKERASKKGAENDLPPVSQKHLLAPRISKFVPSTMLATCLCCGVLILAGAMFCKHCQLAWDLNRQYSQPNYMFPGASGNVTQTDTNNGTGGEEFSGKSDFQEQKMPANQPHHLSPQLVDKKKATKETDESARTSAVQCNCLETCTLLCKKRSNGVQRKTGASSSKCNRVGAEAFAAASTSPFQTTTSSMTRRHDSPSIPFSPNANTSGMHGSSDSLDDILALYDQLVDEHSFSREAARAAVKACQSKTVNDCRQWILENYGDETFGRKGSPARPSPPSMAQHPTRAAGSAEQQPGPEQNHNDRADDNLASNSDVPSRVTLVVGSDERETLVEKKNGHFHVGGHQYTFKVAGKRGVDTWRCSFYRRKGGCSVSARFNKSTGRLVLFNSKGALGDLVEHSDECKRHNQVHQPPSRQEAEEDKRPAADTSKFGVDVNAEVRQLTKRMAIEKQSVPPSAIWTELSQLMDAKYPNGWHGISKQQIERLVYLTRTTVLGSSDVFRHAEHESYRNTKDSGDPFLFVNLAIPKPGDKSKMDRVMGFGHPALMQLLTGKREVFVDATFKCTPKPFYQTLIVMVYHADTEAYIPVCWILMTSKSEALYHHAIFHLVSRTNGKADPTSITCDFEIAIIKQLKQFFPEANINGCLFHWKQACRKKMKSLRLPDAQVTIAMQRNMLDLLCVVPRKDLRAIGIPYIHSSLMAAIKAQNVTITKQDEKNWNCFFNIYFPDQWLNKFTVDVWNLHDPTDEHLVQLLTRVNNALERYNREMGKIFPHGGPNLLQFIQAMEEEARRLFRDVGFMFKGLIKRPDYSKPFIPELPKEYSDFREKMTGQANLKGGADKKQNQPKASHSKTKRKCRPRKSRSRGRPRAELTWDQIDNMDQNELKEACRTRGLPVYGTVAVLKERLWSEQ